MSRMKYSLRSRTYNKASESNTTCCAGQQESSEREQRVANIEAEPLLRC